MTNVKHLFPGIVVVLTTLSLYRLWFALSTPTWFGVDGGAYLISVLNVSGNLSESVDHWARPILAPGFLLYPVVALSSPDIGIKLFHALASIVPVASGYYLARAFLSRNEALLASILIACDFYMIQGFIGGPLPQIAFGLLAIAIRVSMDAAKHGITGGRLAIFALALAPIGLINQTCVPYVFLLAVPAMMIASYMRGRTLRDYIKPVIACSVVTIAIGLSALSYLSILSPDRTGGNNHLIALRLDFHAITLGTAGVILGARMLAENKGIAPFGYVLLALSTMRFFSADNEVLGNIFFRTYSFQTMFVFAAIIYALRDFVPKEKIVRTSIAILVGGSAIILAYVFTSMEYNEVNRMTPDITRAVKIWDSTDDSKNIIVHNFSVARWIEGIYNQPAYALWWRPPPKDYAESDKHVRCILGWVESCDPISSAAAIGVSHVIYYVEGPDYLDYFGIPPNGWESTQTALWLQEVWSNNDTYLLKITQ